MLTRRHHRRVRLHRRRAAAPDRAAPGPRGGVRHRRQPGRGAGRRALPQPHGRATPAWCSRPSTRTEAAGLDLVFLGLPARGQHGARARRCTAGWGASSTSRPRSGSRTPPLPDLVRLRPRPARAAGRGGLRPAGAVPSRAEGRSAHRHPRLLRHGGLAGPRSARAAGPDRARRRHRRRRLRRDGRRAGRSSTPRCSPPSTRTSPPTACSTTATRPRSSRSPGRRCSSRPTWPR